MILREVEPVWSFNISFDEKYFAYAPKIRLTLNHFWRLTKWPYNFCNFRNFQIISELGLSPVIENLIELLEIFLELETIRIFVICRIETLESKQLQTIGTILIMNLVWIQWEALLRLTCHLQKSSSNQEPSLQ